MRPMEPASSLITQHPLLAPRSAATMTVSVPEIREPRRVETRQPDLSIVIVSWNNEREIADCLQSIRDHGDELQCEVFVVDNASRDATCDIVRQRFPEVRLIANADNRGFPAA